VITGDDPRGNEGRPDPQWERRRRRRERDERGRADTDDNAQARADAGDSDDFEGLIAPENTKRFRERWESVQAGFVDKPRETVEQADDLVRDLVQDLTAGFVERRENLERQWNEGDEASTEDLRVALTHYRSFFDRLLST
jgi:hypothetical protein